MVSDYKITMEQAEYEMVCYRKVFNFVRLLDQDKLEKLNAEGLLAAEGGQTKKADLCIGHFCQGCVAMEAFLRKAELCKLEFIGDDIYHIVAKYLEIDGNPYVMELLKKMDKSSLIDRKDHERLISSLTGYNERLYQDVLTKAYNRRYYEEELKSQMGPAGIAMIDLDDFKLYNDTYGHNVGDMALTGVAEAICKHIRKDDILIRYGGDEFLLLLPHIEEATFQQKLQDICCQISETRLPGLEDIRLSVSIGGLINRGEPIDCAVERANQLMMQAKKSRNAVVTDSEIAAEDIAPRKDTRPRMKILIVDDSRTNRAILNGLIPDRYDVLEAADGLEGLDMLRRYGTEIALVLLDLLMPTLSGFDMLSLMAANQWLEEIPVVMISSENDADTIHRAYDLGVSDYITRPFDADVVSQRISNTIKLYARQRGLSNQVRDQIHEKERSNRLMLEIISEVVSARNGESGAHMRHLCLLTEVLLDTLVSKTKRYTLTPHERKVIVTASAFHDIGKMGIDEKILNKSGQLTEEEYIVMKSHTLIGASMLARLDHYRDEELARTAYQICRWHHERYDGGGYPDGLKGEEIPIAAQVVSIADAYDALISPRVYKEGFSHEQAMQMIRNGECGAFNPLLIECLEDSQSRIRYLASMTAERFS